MQFNNIAQLYFLEQAINSLWSFIGVLCVIKLLHISRIIFLLMILFTNSIRINIVSKQHIHFLSLVSSKIIKQQIFTFDSYSLIKL